MSSSLKVLVVVVWLSMTAQAATGDLRVGAARVDITPPADALPFPYVAILDHIHARAIVIDNGSSRAALISADAASFSAVMYSELSKQIAEIVGCPVENVLMTGTHTHSSPPPGAMAGPQPATLDANTVAHGKRAAGLILDAVRESKARMQPARVGFGAGQFSLNVNRDAVDEKSRTWYQGPNLDGPSDKTVAVVKFETLSGEPIAVYMNYAMHAVHYFMRNQLSPDFPGVASRWVEQAFDDRVVAIWTSGAAGDQNPLYLRLSEPAVAPLKRAAIKSAGGPENPDVWAVASYKDAKIDPKILDGNVRIVTAVGTLLGEEVLRVMSGIRKTDSMVQITGAQRMVTCPGRRRTNAGREGSPGTYEDADPVSVRIGLITIGPVAIASVGAEPFNMIAQRLKKESPLNELMVVTIANGQSAGYLPTDDAYGHLTFQVLGTRFKPGCVERGVIDGVLGMISASSAGR